MIITKPRFLFSVAVSALIVLVATSLLIIDTVSRPPQQRHEITLLTRTSAAIMLPGRLMIIYFMRARQKAIAFLENDDTLQQRYSPASSYIVTIGGSFVVYAALLYGLLGLRPYRLS